MLFSFPCESLGGSIVRCYWIESKHETFFVLAHRQLVDVGGGVSISVFGKSRIETFYKLNPKFFGRFSVNVVIVTFNWFSFSIFRLFFCFFFGADAKLALFKKWKRSSVNIRRGKSFFKYFLHFVPSSFRKSIRLLAKISSISYSKLIWDRTKLKTRNISVCFLARSTLVNLEKSPPFAYARYTRDTILSIKCWWSEWKWKYVILELKCTNLEISSSSLAAMEFHVFFFLLCSIFHPLIWWKIVKLRIVNFLHRNVRSNSTFQIDFACGRRRRFVIPIEFRSREMKLINSITFLCSINHH